jgi:3-isopropylmalate/(R)-2-methylmalate dehydratase small subunit
VRILAAAQAGSMRFGRFAGHAINCGFYLIELPAALEKISDGDELKIDYKMGLIKNLTSGIDIRFNPPPDFALEIIADGGLLEHIKNQKLK